MTNHFNDLSNILSAMKKAHLAAGPADAALSRDRLERAARLITDHRASLLSHTKYLTRGKSAADMRLLR